MVIQTDYVLRCILQQYQRQKKPKRQMTWVSFFLLLSPPPLNHKHEVGVFLAFLLCSWHLPHQLKSGHQHTWVAGPSVSFFPLFSFFFSLLIKSILSVYNTETPCPNLTPNTTRLFSNNNIERPVPTKMNQTKNAQETSSESVPWATGTFFLSCFIFYFTNSGF